MKQVLKSFLLPWHTRFLGLPTKPSIYFGSFPKHFGGPDVKIRQLQSGFGNNWSNQNIVYVVSGKPISLAFVKMAKERGCKIVLNQNGVYYPSWYKGDWKRENLRLKAYHKLADYVVYQSRFCFESSSKFICTPDVKHEILYNAVDVNAFNVSERRPLEKTIKLLSATNYGPIHEYALDQLLQSLAAMRNNGLDCVLTIAGPITLAPNWLTSRTAKYHIEKHVRYEGTYDAKKMAVLFKRADIFVHLKHNDACPNVVIEAMAAGLPIVHSISGGTPELVGDAGVGIAVKASYDEPYSPSPEEVRDSVIAVLKNHSAFCERARRRAVERFSIDQWLKRHREIFNAL